MPKVDEETDSLQKELKTLIEKCREKCKNVRDSADLGSGSRWEFLKVHSGVQKKNLHFFGNIFCSLHPHLLTPGI